MIKLFTLVIALLLLFPTTAFGQSGSMKETRQQIREAKQEAQKQRLQQKLMRIQQQGAYGSPQALGRPPSQQGPPMQGAQQQGQPPLAPNHQRMEQAEIRQIQQNTPWAGAKVDPFNMLLDWGGMLDEGTCYVGRPPPGWSGGFQMATVENKTAVPGVLYVDGMMVNVVKAKYASWLPGAWMFMARNPVQGVAERVTGLSPGDTCYMALPEKGLQEAANIGWKVEFRSMWPKSLPRIHVGGAPAWAPWAAAGTHSLNTTPLVYGRTVLSHIKDRGQVRAHRVRFSNWHGLPEYRGREGL